MDLALRLVANNLFAGLSSEHSPHGAGSRSNVPELLSLRLTEDEFKAYKNSHCSMHLPGGAKSTFSASLADPGMVVRIRGYNPEAVALIKASHSTGKADSAEDVWLEVPWSPLDSVLWIMERAEEKLRVKLFHWALAGNGMVLSPGALTCQHSLFARASGPVELLLVPVSAIEEYLSENEIIHVWKNLQPGNSFSSDPRLQAVEEFHLINAQPSPAWLSYLQQRRADDSRVARMMDEYAGEDIDPYLEKIHDTVREVLNDVLCLDEDALPAVADGVLPLSCSAQDDGWGWWSDVETITRIYSPTRPAAVDVRLFYHYRTHYESVDFNFAITYKVHDPVSPESVRARGQKADGWKRIWSMGLKDIPPGRRWRAIDRNRWGLTSPDLKRIHKALWGKTLEGSKFEKIDEKDTLLFLLACVGFNLYVANPEDDPEDNEDMVFYGEKELVKFEVDNASWVGEHIRKLCAEIDGLEDDDEREGGEEDGEKTTKRQHTAKGRDTPPEPVEDYKEGDGEAGWTDED